MLQYVFRLVFKNAMKRLKKRKPKHDLQELNVRINDFEEVKRAMLSTIVSGNRRMKF